MINLIFIDRLQMQKGYSRQRQLMLPPLSLMPGNDQKEKQLLNEMNKIDQILKTDNLTSLHGLIFTHQLKNRVPDDLLNCIKKQHRLISFGFDLWPQSSKQTKQKVNAQSSFQKKLQQILEYNISKFDQRKYRQGERIHWKINPSKHCQSRKKTSATDLSLKKITHLSTIEDSHHSVATTPQNPNKRAKTKVISQPQEHQQLDFQQCLSIQKIQRMLSKVKSNLVTIWLPPKSYPQFYGLLVPSLVITGKQQVRCRIKKYIFFKQSLSYRLFEAILDYLCSLHETYIDRIQLIVNREAYRSYFQTIGFKIQSWQGVQKISVSYSRR